MRKCLKVRRALFTTLVPKSERWYVTVVHGRSYDEFREECIHKGTNSIIEIWLSRNYPYKWSYYSRDLLVSILEITIPSLRKRRSYDLIVDELPFSPSLYPLISPASVSIAALETDFWHNLNQLRGEDEEDVFEVDVEDGSVEWDSFLKIFEDFIKIMKSFKYFNMEVLSDFLATNELHDLWLIVATNKDYKEESAEDRFSL